jgi:hypothetical protein
VLWPAAPHAVGLAAADRIGQALTLDAAGATDGDGRLLTLLGLVEERVVASGHGVAAGRQFPPVAQCGHAASPPWRRWRLARRALAAASDRRAK